jgi:hypothetical protein
MKHLAIAGALAFALSACDRTPPTFTVQPDAGFAVGTRLDDSDFDNDDPEDDYTSPVFRRLRWQAVDDSACAITYDIEEWPAGDEPRLIEEGLTATEVDVWHTDYDGSYGGGSQVPAGWNVIAEDCAGNRRVAGAGQDGSPWVSSYVWQENGENALYWPHDTFLHPVDWTGSWSSSIGPWASGGRMSYTAQPGASVSFEHPFREGDHIGLVMAKGPGRGSADIYVDDVKVATVDTYAPANDNRMIVFDHQLAAGVHTLKVVNLATAGRPRIDVDAFLTDTSG